MFRRDGNDLYVRRLLIYVCLCTMLGAMFDAFVAET